MTRPTPRPPVRVFDVRTAGEHLAALESVDSDIGAILLPEHVVVVANVRDLPNLTLALTRLASVQQLSGVILVAVGSLRAEGGDAVLSVPSALNGVGVTLWVGADSAIEWGGGAARGLSVREDVTVTDLITALRLPVVFERVHKAVSEVPHQVACPAIEIEYARIPSDTLRLLRLRALRQFTADSSGGARPAGPIADAVDQLTAGARPDQTAITPNSPLDRARKVAADAVARATGMVAAARKPGALFTGTAGVDSAVRAAADAVERYQHLCRDVDAKITETVAVDAAHEAELTELGLPAQAGYDGGELAERLTEATEGELAQGRPLRTISEQLKRTASSLSAGGQPESGAGVDLTPTLFGLRNRSPWSAWPTPMAALLAAVALSCLATGLSGPAGFAGGALLIAVWSVLLHRLLFGGAMAVTGRAGLLAAGIGTAVLCTAAPAVATLAGVAVPTAGLPVHLSLLVGLGFGVIALVITARVWSRWHERWSSTLLLDRAGPAQRALAEHLAAQIRTRWLPATSMARYADSLINIAAALDGLRLAFAGAAQAFDNGKDDQFGFTNADNASDLNRVLREDLVRVARAVLAPIFVEIAANGPLSGDGEPYFRAAQEKLTEYNNHLDTHGFRVPPPGMPDDEVRRSLATALWRDSAKAERLLLSGPRSQLPQLCKPGDLRLLSSGDMAMVYFASVDIDDPPVNPDYDLIRAGGDAVGVLRLVPLRAGVVRPRLDEGEGT
ncbi:hypothetical protein [Actinokineospora sp. HUAS TT18]|uniref:hypothetical protein n=1 Tax=Actinokineospora sp. HUAS TT18 TaxID=3447451 RepID=UPI003F528959